MVLHEGAHSCRKAYIDEMIQEKAIYDAGQD